MKTFPSILIALAALLALPSFSTARDTLSSYNNSGNYKYERGDFYGAIVDYTHAIETSPLNELPYANRGCARMANGDIEGALADFNRAIDINPRRAVTFTNRGSAKQAIGNTERAVADYRRACELNDNEQDYPRIYLWVARAKLGEAEAASKELAIYLDWRRHDKSDDWIAVVGGFLLGKVTEEKLFAVASPQNIRHRNYGRLCEAWYFAGIKKLLAADKEGAANCFRKCVGTELKRFTELQLSVAELKALDLKPLTQ